MKNIRKFLIEDSRRFLETVSLTSFLEECRHNLRREFQV